MTVFTPQPPVLHDQRWVSPHLPPLHSPRYLSLSQASPSPWITVTGGEASQPNGQQSGSRHPARWFWEPPGFHSSEAHLAPSERDTHTNTETHTHTATHTQTHTQTHIHTPNLSQAGWCQDANWLLGMEPLAFCMSDSTALKRNSRALEPPGDSRTEQRIRVQYSPPAKLTVAKTRKRGREGEKAGEREKWRWSERKREQERVVYRTSSSPREGWQ